MLPPQRGDDARFHQTHRHSTRRARHGPGRLLERDAFRRGVLSPRVILRRLLDDEAQHRQIVRRALVQLLVISRGVRVVANLRGRWRRSGRVRSAGGFTTGRFAAAARRASAASAAAASARRCARRLVRRRRRRRGKPPPLLRSPRPPPPSRGTWPPRASRRVCSPPRVPPRVADAFRARLDLAQEFGVRRRRRRRGRRRRRLGRRGNILRPAEKTPTERREFHLRRLQRRLRAFRGGAFVRQRRRRRFPLGGPSSAAAASRSRAASASSFAARARRLAAKTRELLGIFGSHSALSLKSFSQAGHLRS